MRIKLLIAGSLAAGFALFAWQTISQVVVPWHEATMREFEDAPRVVEVIRAGAPENGMYFAGQGILAAVAFTPTMADKTSMEFMGPMLLRQFATNVLIGLLLCLMLVTVQGVSPATGARIAAIAAAAAALTINVSNSIWYGFSMAFTLVNSVDLVIGWAIAGAVIGWLGRRIAPSTQESHRHAAHTHGDPGSRVGSLRPLGKH